ncbi:MAG: efflux RND transporter permease subunit, partial [Melioribacteraceae bacterium]|nr:efflux RND transporter permease subunit [Melioribacteraceae bacterium]
MTLPKFALENHQFSTIVIFILVLLGIASFLTMPRSEDPQISPAGTTIYAVYPGANPADVEKLVVQPIEEVLNELDDIKELKSISRTGYGQVDIEFISGSDGDEKYSDVIQKVNSIRNDFPEEVLDVEMIKWTINDVKILQFALISEIASYAELENEAEALEDMLKTTPGIKKIELWAYPEQEVRVKINMERLAQMKLSLNQIISAIQISNINIPGGKLDLGGRQFNIQTSGSFESLTDIENVVVNTGYPQPIYLKDVAAIFYDYEDPTYIGRYNGQRAVYVTASQKAGTNIFDVTDQLKSKAEEFSKNLPNN